MTEEQARLKEENASAGSTENEEIIELTEEITIAAQDDDEIIELVDDADSAKQESDIPDSLEINTEPEEINSSETASGDFPESEIRIGDDIDDELDLDEGEQDDFVNSLGMDLETDSEISQLPQENEFLSEPEPDESAPVATSAISADQIEAAIERVIMKILPEKIDSILSAAIEKTLTREIEKIKTLLIEDSSGNNV